MPHGVAPSSTFCDLCTHVLETADPRAKANAARKAAATWLCRNVNGRGTPVLCDRPNRPPKPDLVRPGQVPRRKINSGPQGRIALLHALAHIEFNAIDLAFDIAGRFCATSLPEAFLDDWIAVGDDEARHFLMLEDRLNTLGASYGDLPAHDGLWQAAEVTAHDLLARLAIVPMVLEARGLDVTPAMIRKLHTAGDLESAEALQIIHDDEIGHVAVGKRWFDYLCAEQSLDPKPTWHELVRKYFKGGIKPPFNTESRDKAGLPADYYEPLADMVRDG